MMPVSSGWRGMGIEENQPGLLPACFAHMSVSTTAYYFNILFALAWMFQLLSNRSKILNDSDSPTHHLFVRSFARILYLDRLNIWNGSDTSISIIFVTLK